MIWADLVQAVLWAVAGALGWQLGYDVLERHAKSTPVRMLHCGSLPKVEGAWVYIGRVGAGRYASVVHVDGRTVVHGAYTPIWEGNASRAALEGGITVEASRKGERYGV